MPTVVELAQGNEFSRSSEGGGSVDSATRTFRVVLSSPGEAWDIPSTIGIDIGDTYGSVSPIPCVGWEARAEGDSKLIRIVTVRYKATPGFSSSGQDPKSESPTQRPALWSMSTSLQDIAAWGGKLVTGNGAGASSAGWVPARNPAGDIIDGLSRLEPVVTINIDQYSTSDGSNFMGLVGYVNQDSFTFSGLTIYPHCCMLQGVSSTPVVEQFSQGLFRGFKITFSFGVRAHWTLTRYGVQAIGWDIAVPQCGMNIINKGFGSGDVEEGALCLAHSGGKVTEPRSLAPGTQDTKCRARVFIPSTEDPGTVQTSAAMAIPLNDDGSPRSRNANPPILINRVCMQPEAQFGTNFSAFGIRYFSLVGN